MLAAVERYHLAGHSGRAENKEYCTGDLFEHRSMRLEIVSFQLDIAESRAWADRVDPDLRRKSLRHRPCGGPEGGHTHRVGKKLRIRAQSPLIDNIDNVPLYLRG